MTDLLLQLSAILIVLSFSGGYGVPVDPSGNTTLTGYREQKGVIFPLDTKDHPEWSRFTATNMSRATPQEDPFIFPDEVPKKKPPKYAPTNTKRSPPCAGGSTFCEVIEDYPADYLRNVLSNKVDEFQAILGVDEVNLGIGQRIDAIDENPLCASMEQVVYPKTAKTKDDKWLYVVNQGPYTQGVRIEKCLKPSESGNTPCEFTEQFPLGYKTMCKQKYIYRKLVALDEDGKPITDIFQLPSCCSCTVKTESIRSRIALDNGVRPKALVRLRNIPTCGKDTCSSSPNNWFSLNSKLIPGAMRHPTTPAISASKSRKDRKR